METESKLPWSKEHTTRTYPESNDPVHNLTPIYLRRILILSFYLRLDLRNALLLLFLSGSSNKLLCVFLIFPMRATCHVNMIPSDLNILIMTDEEYKLRSSSLCSSLLLCLKVVGSSGKLF
jgi:hypothetical protein